MEVESDEKGNATCALLCMDHIVHIKVFATQEPNCNRLVMVFMVGNGLNRDVWIQFSADLDREETGLRYTKD